MSQTWPPDIRTRLTPQPEDDDISLLADTLSEILKPGDALGIPVMHETHIRMPAIDGQSRGHDNPDLGCDDQGFGRRRM